MRRLSQLIIAAAVAACTLPAIAAPLHITIPGGLRPDPRDAAPWSHRYDGGQPPSEFLFRRSWDDPRLPFDPAQAAIDSYFIAHPSVSYRQTWNPELAATLIRTGDSFSTHWIKCQNAYASYSLVTDTYDGPDGLPRACRL